MTLNVSTQLADKLKLVADKAIADSIFSKNADGSGIERVQGTKGLYISSEADGWTLRGPFDAVLVP